MKQTVLSPRALDALNRSQEIQKDLEFCSRDGDLTQQIRRFVRSLEGSLRSELKLEQWTCKVELSEGSSFIWLNLFPESWRLHGDEFVALGVSWCNPFEEEAEDPCVFVRTPTLDAFPGRDNLLRQLRPALIASGFEDSPDAEPYWPLWKYISADPFRASSGFDVDAFVAALVEAFGRLLPCAPIIDGFFQSLPAKRAPRVSQPERHLKIVAFVDTETAGTPPNAKMTELAIILAAYDEMGDQVVGVVEEYSLKKPKTLDPSRVQALLDRAEVTVAHNSAFDRAVLQREMPGTAKRRWLCSYRGIDWKALKGVAAENLQALLQAEGLRCGQGHHALDDARDLLRLLAVRRDGQTYLARLLKRSRTATA